MILKIRVRGGGSEELVKDELNSNEDSTSAMLSSCIEKQVPLADWLSENVQTGQISDSNAGFA